MKDSLKISQKLSPRKYALFTGTLLLTSTGLITRVLGFFYRIFLSRTIGAEGLGLYNMVHPVFGICFALCAGSIQTAISQSVAANVRKGRSIFQTGLVISVSTSFILAWLIIRFQDFLAGSILMEPRCAPLLTYIAVSVPCAAIHACINGYYYGMQRTRVPAFAQVVEQSVRIGAVFLIADIMMEAGVEITVQLAVAGHLIGEIASTLYTVAASQFFPPKLPDGTDAAEPDSKGRRLTAAADSFRQTAPALMALALPLMGNRLVLNILSSAEAIWIPGSLNRFGLSNSEAFSIYGVLTGMALPFILFPSTIFNSLAVLLLPTVAEAQSEGNERRIAGTISMSLRYCLYVGILCIGIFTLFGNDLGVSVFKDENAGSFIMTLAWLCPFLYLVTTMGSILNGSLRPPGIRAVWHSEIWYHGVFDRHAGQRAASGPDAHLFPEKTGGLFLERMGYDRKAGPADGDGNRYLLCCWLRLRSICSASAVYPDRLSYSDSVPLLPSASGRCPLL